METPQLNPLIFPLGAFIKKYLETHEEAYAYQVYKELKKQRKRETYQNVRNYFLWLERLGLIEPTRGEPSSRPGLHNRVYYRLTALGRATSVYDLKWANPRRALYPASWKAKKPKTTSHV